MEDVNSISSSHLLFEPELFGLAASQYRYFASLILLPTVGFVFLYLLGRPLTKLPLIEADPDYSPPRWVLPVFAVGALFAASLSLSIGFFLTQFAATPFDTEFLQSYQKIRTLALSDTHEPLKSADLVISDYDGYSNFYIYVNGYHLFSSEVNCMMVYQCNSGLGGSSDLALIDSLNIRDPSLRHIHQLYPLPHTEAVLGFLIAGGNYIDIFSGNSGKGDCRLSFSLILTFNSFTAVYEGHITSDVGNSTVSHIDPHHTVEVFDSGGTTFALSNNNIIDPYLTMAADPSYRLCERIRITLELAKTALPTQVTDIKQWTKWASDRLLTTYQDITNQNAHGQRAETH
jgi:hypothetical protein